MISEFTGETRKLSRKNLRTTSQTSKAGMTCSRAKNRYYFNVDVVWTGIVAHDFTFCRKYGQERKNAGWFVWTNIYLIR
jgi:hypothetical protein